MGIKPLKKFGQNYLIDKNIVRKMINALKLKENESVVEIGPGKGFITEELFNYSSNITAVEIDTRVINELTNSFPQLKLLQKDFLKIQLSTLNNSQPINLIGNIPFNLTGSILFKLLEEKEYVKQAVLIIPHDIAKRIIAKRRTKEYGILTVLFNNFSSPEIISKVSPNVFLPRPNIDAAIIRILFDKEEEKKIDKHLFIKVVKAAFGNRRKTLNNSLRNSIFNNCDFSNFDFPFSKRAEELDIDDFKKLTRYIQDKCQ